MATIVFEQNNYVVDASTVFDYVDTLCGTIPVDVAESTFVD